MLSRTEARGEEELVQVYRVELGYSQMQVMLVLINVLALEMH